MTLEIALLLGMLVVALVLFALEWVSADVVGMALLLFLVLTGLLPLERAFAGFGSDTTIAIFGLLVMTAALRNTGAVDLLARACLRRVGQRALVLQMTVTLAAVVMSAFISNTAATALLLPIALGIAQKSTTPPSQLLLPIAFGSILASSLTLISTSTNLVVSGVMHEYELERIRMFELTPIGLVIAGSGVLYLALIGRHLIPRRDAAREPTEQFGLRSYLSEVLVLPESRLVGKTLHESDLGRDLDLHVVRIVPARSPEQHRLPSRNLRIQAGDILLVEGPREEVLKIKETAGIEIRPEVTLPHPLAQHDEIRVAEALVVPGSPLVGRTLRGIGFRDRFGVQVLGLHRLGHNFVRKLSHVTLRAGDLLLLQGTPARMAALNNARIASVIGAVEAKPVDRARAWRTAGIFFGAIILAAASIVPLSVAAFLGVFLTFVTRCATPVDAYREVEWRAVILIACMLGVGEAMHTTEADRYLAALLAGWATDVDPRWLLAGFFVVTVVLTQPMSNQAAAAVVAPVAIATAHQFGVDPRPFALTIAVAASCSFLTPLEPACLLVYGPGRYRFSDFLRVGAPLTLLIFAIAIWLIPELWPLRPETAH